MPSVSDVGQVFRLIEYAFRSAAELVAYGGKGKSEIAHQQLNDARPDAVFFR
jgi:hypothetical protein